MEKERRRKMIKRFLIVFVVVAALLATSIPALSGPDGSTPINWKVSGTLAQVWFAPDPMGSAQQPGFLINIVAKGAPGNAQIIVVGWAKNEPPLPSDDCNGDLKVEFDKDDLIATFPDQSMFFAKLNEGWLCIGPDPAEFHLDIVGGTGRFEGATGNLTGTFQGIRFGDSGALLAETGTIVGEIFR